MLPCLAFKNKGYSNVDLALLSGCRAYDQLGKKNFRFGLIKFGVDYYYYYVSFTAHFMDVITKKEKKSQSVTQQCLTVMFSK